MILDPKVQWAAVRSLLQGIGEDPDREGLADTPKRVVKALKEMTAGYAENPSAILNKTFDLDDGNAGVQYAGMICLRGIEVLSLCEHHLLPFVGTASIAYIPGDDGRVVGVSKLARVVKAFARRLSVQERMTAQIAESIETNLKAAGVLVVVEAQHFCMRMRGVSETASTMTTSEVRGLFATDSDARSEALRLMKGMQ